MASLRPTPIPSGSGSKSSPSAPSTSTLRSQRHSLPSTSSSKSSSSVPKKKALSVKEQIALKSLKPLIQGRQFKWISPAQKLKEMAVDLNAVRDRRLMLEGDDGDQMDETMSLFGNALKSLELINLSLPFVRFAHEVMGKSKSLNLVVHFRKDIVESLCWALRGNQVDVELCGEHILDLLPPLITDLSALLLPHLPLLLSTLLHLTTPSPLVSANPKLLQRVYDVLGALFRDLGRDILASNDDENGEGGMGEVWEVLRRGLGAAARVVEEEKVEQEEFLGIDDTMEIDTEAEIVEVEEGVEEEVEEIVGSTSTVPPTTSSTVPPIAARNLPTTLPKNFRTTPQTRRLLGSAFSFLVKKARSTIPAEFDAESELNQLFRMIFHDVIFLEDGGDRKAASGRGAKGRGKGNGKGRGQEDGSGNLLAEGLCWVVVESCSAPNAFLHSKSPNILGTLLSVILSLSSSSPTSILPTEVITHSLTALAQHASSSEAFEPIIDELLKFVPTVVAQEWEKKVIVVKALATVAGFKKGARISATRLNPLLSALSTFSPSFSFKQVPLNFVQAYTQATLSLLLLTSLSDLISPKSPARVIIDSFFDEDGVKGSTCALVNCLDEAGWNLFGGNILGTTLEGIERGIGGERENIALGLLARIAWSGRVGLSGVRLSEEFEGKVAQTVERVVKDWISDFEKNGAVEGEKTLTVLNILLISPQLTRYHPTLLPLLSTLVSTISSTPTDQARASYLFSSTNPAQVLGSTLLSISRTPPRSLTASAVIPSLTQLILPLIQSYSWHRGVIQGVAALNLSRTAADTSPETQKALLDAVLPNLLSEDSVLRLSALKIISNLFPEGNGWKVMSELVGMCIETEEMGLTVQGAREKSMKLRRIGIVGHGKLGRDGEKTEEAVQVLVRYLIAMLKVNFKPLWAEAIGALKLLSDRFPNQVWEICSKQLVIVSTRGPSLYVLRKPEWAIERNFGKEDALVFEEAQLRDHQLEEVGGVVKRELGLLEAIQKREDQLVEPQATPERLVLHSYEAQLLALLCEIPELAQQHSRDFTEVFFGCFQRDEAYGPSSMAPTEKEDSAVAISLPTIHESAKERKIRLLAWLTLYSKFSNPKALYRADDLATQFRTLLAFPDLEVQKLALDCLLRRKSPALTANASRLKNLLEQSKLRDELLQFVSDEEMGGLEPSHRADVVPLFIRIAYGIMTSRAGRASASSGQGRAGRRAAILGALANCSSEELSTLVDLTIGPLKELLVTPPGEPFRFGLKTPKVSGKRQLGFLGFLADLVKHLGKDLVERWPDLIGATLNLLHFAQKGIQDEMSPEEDEIKEEGEDEVEVEDDGEETQTAPLRHIRQLALKRLADFFRLETGFDYTPFAKAAFPSIISPRLPTLAAENGQAPSALLELFVTWATRRDLVHFLVVYDSTLLPALYGCLTVRNVKPAVILRVFDIVKSMLEFASEDGGVESHIGRTIIQPSVGVLLSQLAGLFQANAGLIDVKNEVGQRQVSLLCSLAPYVSSTEQASSFLVIIAPMLRKPNKAVPEKIKSELLKIFTSLYPLARPSPSDPLHQRCFDALAFLFGSARTRVGRLQLVASLWAFASVEPEFELVARLVENLNSFSMKRSEEPDFDRRLAAFSLLNEDIYRTIRPVDWIPIIQNMLYFIQDPDELAIRSNASFALRRFIEVASTSEDPEIRQIVTKTLLPGLRNSLHSKLDLVRSEVLGVYATAVERLSGLSELDQLKCLLVGGDSEANFFYNILHIQVHRRTRALRRLADEVEAGSISSKVVSDVFIPLLDQFVAASDDKKDPDLINETVQCLGRISKHLTWSSYYKLAQYYLKAAKTVGTSQKACVRTLVAVLKGFHFDLATNARLLDLTTTRLLPELLRYLEKREDTDEEVRIPVAEGISAIVQHLPLTARTTPESSLLMALAQILRSTDQHLRDATRNTLCNVAVSAGLEVLPNLIKELRRALQRGPQLHVLAFTVHALLVRLAAAPEGVDFDGALSEIVPVLGDDVFGTPSKDRASPEFRAKTKFREVRSYKSLDSFQLLAQTISPSKLSTLLSPIRDALQRTDSARIMNEADEVFRRLSIGLTLNPRLDSAGILDLCHTLVSQNADFLRPAKIIRKGRKAAADYHVQLTRHQTDERDFYSRNAHKFVSFGLDLFNAAYRKSQFDLDDPTIIARLEPLISVVGNTLYSDDPTVLARSMRATAALIRCPLSSVDKAAPVLVKQMLSIVQRAGSTESELAQSSLRTLAIVIRDCKAATLREDQLTELLLLIGPDLEEADRQATLFQLLRAIMARKFVAPEIYDLMEKVAEILVTNQSSNIREVCRAVYLQFLLDYPQGRGRLRNSLAFLAKNLSYVHESGRLSVLELISAVLSKFAPQLLQESAELFFVGLVMVIANDESTRCRELAGEVVKLLFTQLEKENRDIFMAMLQTWAGNADQPQLARTAVQLFGVVVDTLGPDGKSAAIPILEVLATVLKESDNALRSAEELGEQSADIDGDWQLPYQALQSLGHLYKAFPDIVAPNTRSNRTLWAAVRGHLLYPHIWIRTSSARLLGSLYANSTSSLSDDDLPLDHPLSSPSLLDAAQKACLQLKSPHLTETLAMQIVKNLFFATKCFAARESVGSQGLDATEKDDEDAEELGEEERHANPLRWLFTRLSYQTRAAHQSRPSMHAVTSTPWSLQPASILRWFAAVISYLGKDSLERFLVQMATPIFRISEDPIAQDPQMVELQTLANEVQELLQTKIGTTAYSAVHTQIRQRIANKRNERKTAMALRAINDPAEDAKLKAKRNEQKGRQKKRKNADFASSKMRQGIGSKKRRMDQ